MADWYVLDLDRDPTPGDPDQTRALASWHREEADRIARNVALLRGVASRDSELQLGGDYAPKFRETLQELPPQLDKLRVAYEGCFHALSAYERVLREAKEITATQLARGRNAYHDREQALRQIRALLPAERQLGLGSGLGLNSFVIDGLTLGLDEATRAQVRAAAARAREAERERQAARRIALDAARLREEAADRCAREIENALRDSGIQNKPWYRKAWDFVTTPFRSWDNFVETCRVVTATTAVAAVFVSGPVGWTLLGAAVVAGGVNATATVMRFRQGRASFGELALDLAGVVPGARLLSGAGLAARLSGLTSGAQRTVVAGLSRTRAGVTSIRQGLADVRGRAVEFTRKLLRGDPVDVATGEVVLPQTDVDLAGVLPVRLVRTHLSGYRVGRSFGPSWSSTLDQRVEVEAHRVFFAAEDGMLLVYPKPGEGEAVLPEEGPRWPLSVSPSGGYEIRVPGRGIVLRFGASLPDEPSVHPLIAISDRNGNTIELRRSEDGTVTDIVHPAYHIVVDSADGLVVRLRLRDVAGVEHPLATYRYDHRDRLVEVRDSGRRVLRYEYDHSGRLTAWEDSNGTTYRYGYDGRGRCITATGSDGCLAATFAYGDDATVVTDSLGHQRTYRINDAAQVVAEIDPVGGVHTTAWDRYDRVTARTDPLGRTTAYEYDDAGHLTGITYPDGGRVTIAVNGQGQPVSITDESGAVWRYRYDDPGNLVEVTDPLGARTQYAYDSRGHLVSVTDALGNTVRIETDAAGLATAVVDATGGVTRYERDPFGRPTTITDASGRVIRLTWTPEGRLTSLVTADGARQEWHYDGEGNCVEQVDAAGNTTRVRFTHFDLPEVWTGPDGSQLTFRYDTELRPVMVVNSAGLTWTFEYDPAGNLVRERDFHGRTTTYAYDVAGQMIARTNALGETTTFVWNARGKLVESITGDAVTRYSYDPVGRLVAASNTNGQLRLERDAVGRVVAETWGGRTVTSTYDLLGRRVARRTPSGVESRWEYDGSGRPIALHMAGHTMTFAYDAAGRLVSRQLDGGFIERLTWDAAGRLTAQEYGAATPTTAAPARRYGYQPNGLVNVIDHRKFGRRTLSLDPLGRVTAVQGPGWTESYRYAASGDLDHATWPGTDEAMGDRDLVDGRVVQAGRVRVVHDGQGRVVERAVPDSTTGRGTWRYEWDDDDRLIGLVTPDGQRWRYCYDPLGRRVAKQRIVGHGIVEQVDFTWDGPVLAEEAQTVWPDRADAPAIGRSTTWDCAPGTVAPVVQAEQRRPLAQVDATDVDLQFYGIVANLVGAPTELVDATGSVVWQHQFSLWGATVASTGADQGPTCPLRFPGQYYDTESGLHYNVLRYYDPATATYLSADPLGLAAGPNPYAYVPNPFHLIDPLGLAACDPKIVYRGGSRTPTNFTPRPVTADGRGDPTGLSAWDSLEAEIFKPGTKVQPIDVSKLRELQVVGDASPPGHVTIMPKDMSRLPEWAATRGTDKVHPFTQELLDALLPEIRIPK